MLRVSALEGDTGHRSSTPAASQKCYLSSRFEITTRCTWFVPS
jgi:hypothetical protein